MDKNTVLVERYSEHKFVDTITWGEAKDEYPSLHDDDIECFGCPETNYTVYTSCGDYIKGNLGDFWVKS